MRILRVVVPMGYAEMVAAVILTNITQLDADRVHRQFDVIGGMLGWRLPKG